MLLVRTRLVAAAQISMSEGSPRHGSMPGSPIIERRGGVNLSMGAMLTDAEVSFVAPTHAPCFSTEKDVSCAVYAVACCCCLIVDALSNR